jgi:erythronate-4-phosphate dehydrogenase
MLKILADSHIPYLKDLFSQNFEIIFYQQPEELNHLDLNFDVLICRSNAKIKQKLIEKSQFKIIATASSGTEHIDLKTIKTKGLQFYSGHGANAHGVCDYVTASLAYLIQNKILKQPKIAIIGFGAVGKKLNERLKYLKFETGIYDPFIPNRPHPIDLRHLKEFNLICLHPNYHQQSPYASHLMINENILEQLSEDTCILNAARGKIVDENAIINVFKGIYCTDVYWNEPQVNPDIIAGAYLATPHIAGHTIEAKKNISMLLAKNIHEFFGLNWHPSQILKSPTQLFNTYNWQELALEHYNPILETRALKADPCSENFSHLRRLHQFRHDFPWGI